MKNKLNHKIGRFFQKVSRWFFDRTLMACWHCGALVGMNSTYTQGHMWCEPCYQRYVVPVQESRRTQRALDALPESECPYCHEKFTGTYGDHVLQKAERQ